MRKDTKQQLNPQSKNQYKALYQLTRKKRTKNANNAQSNIPKSQISDQPNSVSSPRKQDDDSLEKYRSDPKKKQESKNNKAINISNSIKNIVEPQIKLSKKSLHNRSHSCPFMNPTEIPIRSIRVIEDQSRRTLKKTSSKNYMQRTNNNNMRHHENNAHYRYKNLALQHKYSGSQLSQETNTVVVHSLPIEQLSSMLYSKNHEINANHKESEKKSVKRNADRFSKKNKVLNLNNTLQISLQTSNLNKKNVKDVFSRQLFSINNDIYFNTRLQQQIKMYDLNQDMKNLQKQTENVKIKQQILQKLAQKFQLSSESFGIITDQCSSDECNEDSLLIH